MTLKAGKTLGPYQIVAPIGAGGMGEVYRATDTRIGRDVAIKVLPEHLSSNQDSMARFYSEARSVAAISHPNILALFEFETADEVSFVVNELLEGETLGALIERGPIPWRQAVEIGIAIADGLSAAHARGIVHRDLKPENIFLTSEGRVKILDFGLARAKAPLFKEDESSPTAIIESSGMLVGTAAYMSPEQVRGEIVEETSDLFSLGSIFYEMLTGVKAFGRGSMAEIIGAVLYEPSANLESGLGKVPADLRIVVMKCLEKNPLKRVQSAKDLLLALKATASGSTSSSVVSGLFPKARKKKTIGSLAVLPFSVQQSATPAGEFLIDSLTEGVIGRLSVLPRLRVMARSTVFHFKGKSIDPRVAGRDLNVDAVFTGSALQQDESVLFTCELVKVEDGSRVWGAGYEETLRNLFSLQEKIASDLSKNLRPRLSGEQKKRVAKRHTKSDQAYELYSKGRFHWNRRTVEGLKKAIEFFQQAIEDDPSYALAYSGLADCYSLLCNYGIVPPSEGYPKAKAAALRALKLDPSSAEAHTSLAYVHLMHDWDWTSAAREFQRALAINPSYATAHHWYSHYFEALGRNDEALEEIRHAHRLDPLSLVIEAIIGFHLFVARRYGEAIRQYRMALDMDANFFRAHLDLFEAYLETGDEERAVEHFLKGKTLSGSSPTMIERLERAFRGEGIHGFFRAQLELLDERARVGYVPPTEYAVLYLRLGENDKAMEWLETAFIDRSDPLVFLRRPVYDPIRTNPKFADLQRRVMGFQESAQ